MKTLQEYFIEQGENTKHHISVDIKPHGVAIDLYHKKTEANYYSHNGFAVIGNVVFPSGVGQGNDLDFSQALALMKDGEKVARSSWAGTVCINPQKVFICLKLGTVELEADKFWNQHSKQMAIDCGGKAKVVPYFIKCNGNIGTVQMGWIPTQEDLLANDWYLMT